MEARARVPMQPDRFHVRVLQLGIQLEGLQVEVIDVGKGIRGLEGLLVPVPLLHPGACTLDLGVVLAVQGMCWLTSPPNLLNLLRICCFSTRSSPVSPQLSS